MKNAGLTVGFLIFFRFLALTQGIPGEMNASFLPSQHVHYGEEYIFDSPADKQAWDRQWSGLHVSFGSTDKAYFRSEVPEQKEVLVWEATGWRGERLSTQLLVWSRDSLEQVRISISDLVSANGKMLSQKNMTLNLVRYVLSNYPYGAKDAVCGDAPYKNGYLMPDRFESFEFFDLPGQTTRPVWLSLDIPPGCEPGLYTGSLTVSSTTHQIRMQLKMYVQKQVLPPPKDWKYRLDLWQNPWVIAWRNHLKPWSDEHREMLKKHLKLYAEAGGKYITTYAVHSPWADNSYMIEGGMIDWIKTKDGSWKFDYSIFDAYVELAMQAGITKAITIYTAIPWGNRFRYKEESTGNYIFETWAPDSKSYTDHWNIFLTDLKIHLQKKGWLEKTYIGINENEMKQTLMAIQVIKKHSKSWRITYAGNWHKELDGLVDDYSFLYGYEPTMEEQKQRMERGLTSTFYVCCNPAKPNNFVFSPPIEGTWISWYSAAFGYNGFLRWAYDAWPEDPVRDARFGSWPAGDCFMVYPGANSCIRFEKLREGIVDYEKIRILKGQVSRSTDRNVAQLWQKFEEHMKVFTAEHDFDEGKITGQVNTGKALINELSNQLGQLNSSPAASK